MDHPHRVRSHHGLQLVFQVGVALPPAMPIGVFERDALGVVVVVLDVTNVGAPPTTACDAAVALALPDGGGGGGGGGDVAPPRCNAPLPFNVAVVLVEGS